MLYIPTSTLERKMGHKSEKEEKLQKGRPWSGSYYLYAEQSKGMDS